MTEALIQVYDKTFEPYIPADRIQARIAQLGQAITQDYADKKPLIIGILNGSFMFLADLVRHIGCPAEVTFAKVASYHGTGSTGTVKQLIGLEAGVKGRHVIFVEDIVDTGLTMHTLLEDIRQLRPASVRLASLLLKREALRHEVPVDYCGFEIPDRFVLGYGLDYDGLGRNYADIYVLKGSDLVH